MGNICNCFRNKNQIFLKKCLSNNELEAVIYYSNNYDSIDIRANNDYIFNLICSYNYTDIAQWLCTLEDNYRIIIKNNNIIKYWVKDEIYGRIPLRAAKIPPINSDCYICLENKKLHQFTCNHGLCKDCLIELLGAQIHLDCGLCRKKITHISIYL